MADTPKLEEHPLNTTLSQTPTKKMVEARELVKAEVEVSVSHQRKGDEEAVNLANLADMMILLVDKWRRAYWMTLACVVLILVCVGMLVKAGFEMDYLQRNQRAMQEDLSKMKGDVKETKDEVKKTTDEVKETKDAVKEAAEAAPKVEVDDQGKARVVIRVSATPDSSAAPPPPPKSSAGMGGGGGALVTPPAKSPPKSPPSKKPPPAQTSVPLNPEIDFY